MNAISTDRTRRILQVVGGMNRAGVETWLMHVLRHIDRGKYKIDFLVHTDQPCAYDEEIRSLDSNIYPCLHPSNPLRYAYNFKKIVSSHGPFDVIHSHVHHFSGFVLRLAFNLHIPKRIAHSHNDLSAIQKISPWYRRLYFWYMHRCIQKYATIRLACSRLAANNLFGDRWDSDPRCRVLYCGIDLKPFKEFVDRKLVRDELGIPLDAYVIGHVGRFMPQKNHNLIIDIFHAVLQRIPHAFLLLVGDGPLRNEIENKINRLGMGARVLLTGSRSDVPRLMKGAMDLFLFPSLYEGLGLAVVEAQACGLPCVISDSIPEETTVIPNLICRINLENNLFMWSNTIKNQLEKFRHIKKIERIHLLKLQNFEISRCIEKLILFYDTNIDNLC